MSRTTETSTVQLRRQVLVENPVIAGLVPLLIKAREIQKEINQILAYVKSIDVTTARALKQPVLFRERSVRSDAGIKRSKAKPAKLPDNVISFQKAVTLKRKTTKAA